MSDIPRLRELRGKTVVIKYGGNAMTDSALQAGFAQDIVALQTAGVYPVVVHGGGPQIENALNRLNKKGEFIQGMRVTDSETMQVVQWVLAGQVQQEIVGLIQQAGGRAVGLTGCDAGLIHCEKLALPDLNNPHQTHDIGWVGNIVEVNPAVLQTLQAAGLIPVVSPIGWGAHNQAYNVNADVVAGSLARALQAENLVLLTNTPGVLDSAGRLLTELTPQTIDVMLADGTIHSGMLPKMASALEAAKSGVPAVHIVDGRQPHVLLGETLAGTVIRCA